MRARLANGEDLESVARVLCRSFERASETAQERLGPELEYQVLAVFWKAQVRELCTHYGEIHGFWWDMNVDQHVDPSINDLIRKLRHRFLERRAKLERSVEDIDAIGKFLWYSGFLLRKP